MTDRSALILAEMNSSLPERKLQQLIERTNLSADMKALLADLARITVKIGNVMVSIGRKILTFSLELVKTFPTTSLAVIVTLVVASYVAPAGGIAGVIAYALGPVLKGMLACIAIPAAALRDLVHPDLLVRVDDMVESFVAVLEA